MLCYIKIIGNTNQNKLEKTKMTTLTTKEIIATKNAIAIAEANMSTAELNLVELTNIITDIKPTVHTDKGVFNSTLKELLGDGLKSINRRGTGLSDMQKAWKTVSIWGQGQSNVRYYFEYKGQIVVISDEQYSSFNVIAYNLNTMVELAELSDKEDINGRSLPTPPNFSDMVRSSCTMLSGETVIDGVGVPVFKSGPWIDAIIADIIKFKRDKAEEDRIESHAKANKLTPILETTEF
jgi:hypothetical protein